MTAGFFLAALFCEPLIRMIGAGYVTPEGHQLYPTVAPALILIGSFMVRGVREIPWGDPTEAIPAFLTMLVMPVTLSITDGIAFGLIAYTLLKLATGRLRDGHWMIYLFARPAGAPVRALIRSLGAGPDPARCLRGGQGR